MNTQDYFELDAIPRNENETTEEYFARCWKEIDEREKEIDEREKEIRKLEEKIKEREEREKDQQ